MLRIRRKSELLSTKAMNELSDKEKRINEQAKQIEEKEQDGSSDAMISKDEEIIAAAEKLQEKERIHAEMSKRLEDTEALSNRAVKKLSEKQRIIQEQAQMIKKRKGKKGNLGGCRKSEREKSKCDSICSPKCCAKHFTIRRAEYDAFFSANSFTIGRSK